MKYIVDEGSLSAIADAIREKTGDPDALLLSEMPEAVRSISGGGDEPTGTLAINSDGLYNVAAYANADVYFDQFSNFEPEYLDPSDWERPEEWQPEAIYDDSVEQLFMVYDTELLAEGSMQFACWYATTNSGNLLIERGYVTDAGVYEVVSSTDWTRNTSYVEDLPDLGTRFVVYRITPKTGHITAFYHDRPTTAYNPYVTGTNDYCRLCQPMVECYGSLPYATSLCYTSATRRFNTLYCKRFAVKNLTSLTTCNMMFYDSKELECVDHMETWDTSNVTTFAQMFQVCLNLTHIKCKLKITSKCTSMQNMFYGCRKLRRIDTSEWVDTSKVTNMNYLFRECYKLETVDLSNLKGDSVTTFGYLFNSCYRIREVDLSNFVTPKATNQTLQNMFSNCFRVRRIDLSGMIIKPTSVNSMFSSCYYLREITFGNGFDTSLATNMASMFQYCYSLQAINGLENLTCESNTTFASTFASCFSLKEIDISGFKCSGVTTVASMFYACYNVEEIILQDAFINSTVTSLATMFQECHKLKTVNLKGWDTSKITTMKGMFQNCRDIENIDEVASWDFTLVKDLSTMFSNCTSVERLPSLSGMTFPACTTMASMFAEMHSLTEINLNNISAPLCTTVASLFSGGYKVTKAVMTNWDLPLVTTVSSIFLNNYALKELTVVNWNAPKIVTITSFIQNCMSLSEVNCNLDFSKATSLSNVFSACYMLSEITNFPSMPKLALTLSQSTMYTVSGLVEIMESLPTLTTALNLALGATNLGKLSDSQKAVATSKGWVLK